MVEEWITKMSKFAEMAKLIWSEKKQKFKKNIGSLIWTFAERRI